MRTFSIIVFATTLSFLAALSSPPAEGANTAKAPSGVTFDFKDVELADLIQTVSELTGKNFIYDDTVKGKVTIISPRSMSLAETYQVFLSVLNVKGFTVVPAGKVNKIVASREAKENRLPTIVDDTMPASEQYMTRLVPLQNIDVNVLASTVLTPLTSKTGNIVAFAPTNTLILTDTANNIERLMEIIRQLDNPRTFDRVEVIPLGDASAEEMVQIATQVLTLGGASNRARTQASGQTAASKVIAYPRANALVVMGSNSDIEAVQALVRELDNRPGQSRSNINVYYLENADAETLAKTLNEMLSGSRGPALPAKANPGAAPASAMTDAVSVTADKPTNALIINASPEDFGTLRAIVRQLDVKRKQVFVEALILELSMDATRDLGASIAGFIPTGDEGVIYGGMNQTAPAMGVLAPASGSTGALATTPSLLTQSITGIMAGGLFNLIDIKGPNGEILTVPAISALINLSKTDGDINILSAPRLLTSDNEEAEIVVGSNVPIISSRLTNAVGGSDSLAQSVTVERKDVALTLRFTPQVTEGNLVRLKIFQEMTDLAASNIGNVNDVGPTLTKRLLKNTVLAENGKTVVLGGLIGTNNQISETKVPFLGDIPLLGWLFKTQSSSSRKTNLLIFITPRIIRNAEDLAEVTRRSHDAMQRFRVEEMGQDVLDDRERLEPYLNIGTPTESVPEATAVPPSVLAPAPAAFPAESNNP